MIATQKVNLRQLGTELAAAGVTVNALGQRGNDVHTYNAAGRIVDLPPAAAGVLAAHVAVLDPQAAQDNTDMADLQAQATALMTRLTAIETQMSGTPTNAQVVAVVKDLATGEKRLLRALAILARTYQPATL